VAVSLTKKPMRLRFGVGGVMSSRIASKTTLNWASYFVSTYRIPFQSFQSFKRYAPFKSFIGLETSRTKARMISILTCTERLLRRTIESMPRPAQ